MSDGRFCKINKHNTFLDLTFFTPLCSVWVQEKLIVIEFSWCFLSFRIDFVVLSSIISKVQSWMYNDRYLLCNGFEEEKNISNCIILQFGRMFSKLQDISAPVDQLLRICLYFNLYLVNCRKQWKFCSKCYTLTFLYAKTFYP